MPVYEKYFVWGFIVCPIFASLIYGVFTLYNDYCNREEPEELPIVVPTHTVQHIHSIEPLEVAQPIQFRLFEPSQGEIQTAEKLPKPEHDFEEDHVQIYI
jgi:hypothetical protein